VVAGGVLWLTGRPERPTERSVAIAPQLGAASGLAVVGRF
jgi:hypothetical protein